MKSDSIIERKSYELAVRIVKLTKLLSQEKKEYILSKQILRSGTSIGANVSEALGGSSKKDFIFKMNLSYKESLETKYWLRLLNDTGYIELNLFSSLYKDAEEVSKILFSIIATSKENSKTRN